MCVRPSDIDRARKLIMELWEWDPSNPEQEIYRIVLKDYKEHVPRLNCELDEFKTLLHELIDNYQPKDNGRSIF